MPKVVTICLAMLDHLLEVARGAGGDLGVAEDDLLRRAAAERAHDARENLLLADEGGVLAGDEPGETLRLAAGHEGDLLDGVVAGGEGAADGVANLVVGDEGLGLAVRHAGALHAGDEGRPSRQSRRERWPLPRRPVRMAAVEKVREIRPEKPGVRLAMVSMSMSSVRRLFLACTLRISMRPLTSGLSTDTWRSKRPGRRMRGEDVRPVGGRDDDDALVRLKAVHLGEELVEGLLALVVPASETRASVTSNGINLVNEHDAGCVFLALLEQISNA